MRRVPLPAQIVESARSFESGEREPAQPRDAATVVLMRSAPRGPEIYLLKRQASMAFAGGMCVFPGGGVDPRDFDRDVAWSGPSPEVWAGRLGVDEAMARALVCAAVRETFEESGVLLAGESADSVVADTTAEDWEADRVALESRELSMTDFLQRRGLVLRTDLLGAWSAWLTPIFEPRRYRTWFFVATMPEGQLTRDVSTESTAVEWTAALSAVERVESGSLFMLPPTYLTCLDIGQHATPEEVLAQAEGRSVQIFMPNLERVGDADMLSVPPELEALLETRER